MIFRGRLAIGIHLEIREAAELTGFQPREGAMKIETDVKAGGAIWQHNETIVG